MGGIIIMLALAVAVLRFGEKNLETVILLVAALGYGLIGFLDDYIKILFKRSLGLTARQKLLGQLVLSGIVCFCSYSPGTAPKYAFLTSTFLLTPGGFIFLLWCF